MLSRAPFVSVTLFFATGILAGDALRLAVNMPVFFAFAIVALAGIVCLLLYIFWSKQVFTISMAAWMVLLGITCKTWVETERDRRIVEINDLHYTACGAEVISIPEKRNNSIRVEVKTERFRIDEQWTEKSVSALIYLPDSVSITPEPGDRLLIRKRLELPAPPQNPEQFDYALYLRNKGILFTAFLNNGSYQVMSGNADNNPAYWPEIISQWADSRFREHVSNTAAYGLVKAMLLGRRDDLHEQQVGDYVISGAVHILSVSGMHMAIIFMAISAAFGWLRRWPVGKWLYFVLMAALLGFYGLVTGLPPSVQRAALMCMVLVAAETGGRKHHPINTLAISALIILLIDACALYDVGFQLSFLAMAGIFLLYEPVCDVFAPSNRLLKYIWQVTVLALAAQIATFPLSLYYFHQFPTYFWLVNPLVVTFTNVLLPAALVLLFVSAIGVSWLAWLAGKIVSVSAWLTDWSASIPRSLPGHLLENLHLSALEVVMLYGIIFLVWYTLHSHSVYFLRLSVVAVMLFVTISLMNSLNTYLTAEQVSFQIPKHHVVGFKSGNALYLVSDKAFALDKRAFDFNVKNYAVNREIRRIIRLTAL
ncbi:competence protein ComEC family protein [Dyadobacter sp. CY261]|uniref:ComEC/Rec2 family competence protein n=1 Tax=Dyadobacter sp. CY261 TaxID=2907203 RepID=UPI001F456692|nr:ComEC/Rec2 family competence protein [Dyadobacter sp. CY261]MCF0069926.1 competence protein ComEC family protein [Dyadobacter sp. CY261]